MGLTEKDSIKERARPMGDFTDWKKNGNTVLLGKEETPLRHLSPSGWEVATGT